MIEDNAVPRINEDVIYQLQQAITQMFLQYNTQIQACLTIQLTRLITCENYMLECAKTVGRALETHKQIVKKLKEEKSELLDNCSNLSALIQKEKYEHDEDIKTVVELWPENITMPTFLKPHKAPKSSELMKNIDDIAKRRCMEAKMNRRWQREKIRQQIQYSKQWETVLVPESIDDDGNIVQEQQYYQNNVTGECQWDAPAIMLFEPPDEWDVSTNDWKVNFGYEHFYTDYSDDNLLSEEANTDRENSSQAQRQCDRCENSLLSNDTEVCMETIEDDGENNEPILSAPEIRGYISKEFENAKNLQSLLAESTKKQQILAMQLMNATQACFEGESEQIKITEEQMKDTERKRRLREREESLAALAQSDAYMKQAIEADKFSIRKNTNVVQSKFATDSVTSKNLRTDQIDDALEKELQEFVSGLSINNVHLCIPMSLDPNVRRRKKLDVEYTHMKLMEEKFAKIEHLELDLVEIGALRLEETESLMEQLGQSIELNTMQIAELEMQRLDVEDNIQEIEVLIDSPRSETLHVCEAADTDAVANSNNANLEFDVEQSTQNSKTANRSHNTKHTCVYQNIASDTLNIDTLNIDTLRNVDFLEGAYRKYKWIKTSIEQLELEIAIQKAELQFVSRIEELEQETNKRLWDFQKNTQVERVRFMVERSCREESVLTLEADLKYLADQFESAMRLPDVAITALQQVDFEEEAQLRCAELQKEIQFLQTRYDAEVQAKELLMTLEIRFCDYLENKLMEEYSLHREKQVLWDRCLILSQNVKLACEEARQLAISIKDWRNYKEVQDPTEIGVRRVSDFTDDLSTSYKNLRVLSEKRNFMDAQMPEEKYPEKSATDTPKANTPQLDRFILLSLRPENDISVLNALHKGMVVNLDAKLDILTETRQYLLMAYHRENRWRSLAATTFIKDVTSHEWMSTTQARRNKSMIDLQKKYYTQMKTALESTIRKLNSKVESLETRLRYKEENEKKILEEYKLGILVVEKHNAQIIRALSEEVTLGKVALIEQEKISSEHLARIMSQNEETRTCLVNKIQIIEKENNNLRNYLIAVKREIKSARTTNNDLLRSLKSIERKRASEVNDLRFRVAAQIKRINDIEMWNQSLQMQANEVHAEHIKIEKELQSLQTQHQLIQRRLRKKNWKHLVTAQAILSDVNDLFAFFSDGLAILAGTTKANNDALRENGAIEIICLLVTRNCQPLIREQAALTLGVLCWNRNVAPRYIGWKAKSRWLNWVYKISTRVEMTLDARNHEFDSIITSGDLNINWCDTAQHIQSIAIDKAYNNLPDIKNSPSIHALCSLKISNQMLSLLGNEWIPDEFASGDDNIENQQYIGLEPKVLQKLVDLSFDTAITKSASISVVNNNASKSLLLALRNIRNVAVAGRMEGLIELLVHCMKNEHKQLTETEVSQYIQIIAKLTYQNDHNQRTFIKCGAIRALLDCLQLETDVDILVACMETMCNLSYNNKIVSEQITQFCGLQDLVRLCVLPKTVDAVEHDTYEFLQSLTVEVIANIVALLSHEEHSSSLQCSSSNFRNSINFLWERDEKSFQSWEKVSLSIQGHHSDTNSQNCSECLGIRIFVLLAASCNRDTSLHAIVILRCVAALDDKARGIIGDAGGVEVLFLLLGLIESPESFDYQADKNTTDNNTLMQIDLEIWIQSLAALANLTWNRENQYRIVQYLDRLYQLCSASFDSSTKCLHVLGEAAENISLTSYAWNNTKTTTSIINHLDVLQVQELSHCIVANILFHNDSTRVLVGDDSNWYKLLLRNSLDVDHDRWVNMSILQQQLTLRIREHCARALCSLSYNDRLALKMGSKPTLDREIFRQANREKGNCDSLVTGMFVLVQLCRIDSLAISHPSYANVSNSHTQVDCRVDNNIDEVHTSIIIIKNAIYAIVNMCLHEGNKSRLIEIPDAIQILVKLSGVTNDELCGPAIEVLDLLANARGQMAQVNIQRVHHKLKYDVSDTPSNLVVDLTRYLDFISHDISSYKPDIIIGSCSAICDMVCEYPISKTHIRDLRGIEHLLRLSVEASTAILYRKTMNQISTQYKPDVNLITNWIEWRDEELYRVLYSALWALRNVVINNEQNQNAVQIEHSGMDSLNEILRVGLVAESHDMVNIVLVTLIALIMNNQGNSLRLVELGLDPINLIASISEEKNDREQQDEDSMSFQNSDLAREILHLIAIFDRPQSSSKSTEIGMLNRTAKVLLKHKLRGKVDRKNRVAQVLRPLKVKSTHKQ